jgi:serine/threonine protein kinase/Tfp pilus assembly protein PilF
MKETSTSCPTTDAIEQLLLSDATEEQLQELADHLDSCEACRRRAESIGQQASLESDLHWATEVREQTTVSIEDPLHRLSAILPEYNLIREIGRGGMGIVYEAEQPKLHRKVAIKVLPALIGVVRPEYKARFRREAELAAGLDHTNIISVYDFGEADGTMYYTMQLIDGRSLRAILTEIEDTGAVDCVVGSDADSSFKTQSRSSKSKNQTGIPEVGFAYFREVAHWISEVAEAMQYAHDHGVIHRDIKPSNLLLTKEGRLMISDFGLARPSGIQGITASNSLLGTARYMAPEQFSKDSSHTRNDLHLVDVYALGATLYEMLAFRPAFSALDDRTVVHQIQNNDIIPPSRYVRQIPTELETVCLKAVSRDRNDRYASAEEFADDLRRWALDMPIHARRHTVPERVVRYVKRRKLITSLTVASLVLAGTAGTQYLRTRAAQMSTQQAINTANIERTQNLTQQALNLIISERFEDAVSIADQAMEITPHYPSATHAKSTALSLMGKEGEANKLLLAAIARDPTDWNSRFLHGMYTHSAHEDSGNEINSHHSGEQSDYIQSSVLLGGYIADMERLNPGSPELFCLRSCVEPDHSKAIALLDQALELDSTLTIALVEKAVRVGLMGQYQEALQILDMAIDQGHGGHRVHALRGLSFYHLGLYDKAVAALSDAIDRNPRNSDWWYDRAVSYSYLGQNSLAIEDANRALEIDPNYAGAYMVRARAYTASNQPAAALKDFAAAIEIDPTNGDIYVERGQLYWLMQDYESSLKDANTLISLEPNQIRGYQRRVSTYLMLKEWDKGLADLETCEQLQPNEETVHRLRGGLLFHAKRYEEAIESFNISTSMLPDFYGSYEYRAMSFFRLNRYQEAIADLTHWIVLDENQPLARMRRGMVYEIMGEYPLALDDYSLASQNAQVAPYASLWSGLLMLLNGDSEGVQFIESVRSVVQPGTFIASVTDLFQGVISAEDLLTRATSDSSKTEAMYYIGVFYELNGQNDLAAEYYERSALSGALNIHEIDFANARLYKLLNRN